MARSPTPAPAARLAWPAVLALRVARQGLAERAPRADALGVLARICGLHAQVMSSAELTLWTRTDGLEPADVPRWLWEERRLVKTWAQRGTLHLLPAAELGLWTAAQTRLKPRHHVPAWLRAHGLSRAQADAMLAAIPAALDGRTLTREALAREVAAITGIDALADKLRGGFGDLLKPAAFAGDLCFAPSEGRSVRFARPDQWLGTAPAVDPAEAEREVARRYLAAYGPGTREAYARWFGITSPAQAERRLRALGDEVVPVELDGETAWLLAADLDAVRAAEGDGGVRLLPAFDQYVVAAPRAAGAVLAPELRDRVYRPQGWLSPVILAGGRMLGTWRHEAAGDRVRVTLEPFAALPAAVRRGAAAEAERLAAHLGSELELA